MHDSDCSLHNAPALPVGPCDCSQSPSYQRGFNEGFAAATERIGRSPRGYETATGKKISIAFTDAQYEKIDQLAKDRDCSFAAAVRHLIDGEIA